ncbi:hypothetical protein POTOM_015540 [Populus tomentosa]|uniref:Uncharacterized protein n=1 Tax=Populus tomentosa TaxID=118781 RepID=A0A8X8D5M4_POPTO|nr:hypothetical protein POTOM_015540 [Populus tomentosa]
MFPVLRFNHLASSFSTAKIRTLSVFEKLYYEKRNLASTAVLPLEVGALNAIQGNRNSDVWSRGIGSAHQWLMSYAPMIPARVPESHFLMNFPKQTLCPWNNVLPSQVHRIPIFAFPESPAAVDLFLNGKIIPIEIKYIISLSKHVQEQIIFLQN